MTREQILKLARDECWSRGFDRRGLVSVDIGAGWMIVRHTHAEWLVVF